jgi:hypothetical protein
MRHTNATLFAIALFFTAACGSDSTSTGTPNAQAYLYQTPDEEVPATNRVAGQTAQSFATRDAQIFHPSALVMGAVTIDQVDSIMIDVLAVGAVQPTDTSEVASALTINQAQTRINFRSLPKTKEAAIALATGILPPGRYSAIRLRFNGASITLNTAVTSRSLTFVPGKYPLEMLHGITYAADAPADTFDVARGANMRIDIVFDLVASVASIKAATDGNLEMTPVFSASASIR